MDYNPTTLTQTASVSASSKLVPSTQRDIDISKERGMSLNDIYSHDLLPLSPIFEGDLHAKPDKSTLITELDKYIVLD